MDIRLPPTEAKVFLEELIAMMPYVTADLSLTDLLRQAVREWLDRQRKDGLGERGA